jgi:cobaltochelatase CobT
VTDAGVADFIGGLVGPALLFFLVLLGYWGWLRRDKGSGCVEDGPEGEPYHVFTREFDLTLPWPEAIAGLAAASPDAERSYLQGPNPLDIEALKSADAMLEDWRASRPVERDELLERIRSAAGGREPGDFVVAVLIDQSGSMKGWSIAFASATAALLVDLVSEFGARSEVLGFSTAGWQGGFARRKWLEAGRPARPGRLCALRHVIFKSAEEPDLADAARHAMAHADLLRENVDGEAILWARERLAALPEQHKILLVVSDGAPVDDSTLYENGPSILYRHVEAVLAAVDESGELTIGGLGINHQVDVFYPVSAMVETPQGMPMAGARLLEKLVGAAGARVGTASRL